MLAVLLCCVAGPARADPAKVDADAIDWQLGVGLGPSMLLGDVCRDNGGDVVECSTPVPFLRADLSLDRRVLDWLWLGPVAAFGFEAGSGRGTLTSTSNAGITRRTEDHRSMWLLGLRAKVQERPGDGAFGALHLGALAIQDSEDSFDAADRPIEEQTMRQWAFVPGLDVGYDLGLNPLLSLGIVVGGSWVFAPSAPDTERSHYAYDAGPAARLAVELRVLLSR
ncbi:MAG: hypothetical protein OXT09_02955 [Myxococcales bacterium]|nr:hypothetical protein [Myxococcales bacterium]